VVISDNPGDDAEVKNVSQKKPEKIRLAVNDYYKNASGEEVKMRNGLP